MWLYDTYKHWPTDCLEDTVSRFVADVMECAKFETWQVNASSLESLLRDHAPTTYSEAVSLVYMCFGLTWGESFERWGDKNNFHLLHIDKLQAMFPQAQFIHIIRDGRNVAVSYRRVNRKRIQSRYAPKFPDDIAEIARQWRDNIRIINASLKTVPDDRVCQVRLKDLTRRPEIELGRICSEIGEEYDPRMLEFHRFNRELHLEPPEFLQWKEKTLEPVSPERETAYLEELDPEEIDLFDRLADEELREYGYPVHSRGTA